MEPARRPHPNRAIRNGRLILLAEGRCRPLPEATYAERRDHGATGIVTAGGVPATIRFACRGSAP